jgi:hypothetical protein
MISIAIDYRGKYAANIPTHIVDSMNQYSYQQIDAP